MTTNPKKSDFSIAKYFLSYLTLRKSFKITPNSLILCTAAKLNVADIMDKLPADENLQKIFGSERKMYKAQNKEGMVDKFLDKIKQFQEKINENEKDKEEWKNSDINTEDIKTFICSFVVVKIDLMSIKSLIGTKLNELGYKFPISSYEYVKDRVEEWYHLSTNKFVPMTKDYLMFILCGEHNRNFFQDLVNTNIYFKESHQFNSDNIICVQIHDNIAIAMHLIKILRSIQKSEKSYFPLKENILCLMQEKENIFHQMKYTMQYTVLCDMINTFKCDNMKYLVVSFLSLNKFQTLELYKKICDLTKENRNKKVFIIIKEDYLQSSKPLVKIIDDKIYFNSLESDTQNFILDKKILFQGELVPLKDLKNVKNIIREIDEIEIDECIEKIIFNKDYYSIGCNFQNQSKPDEFYINRSLMDNSKIFPEKDFFEKIDKNIVVITGPSGAGKTTILKKIVKLKKGKDEVDSKLTWIINVDLRKTKQFFRKGIEKNMTNLLCHNENITANVTPDSSYLAHLERKLIESMDKILIIDGLDENNYSDDIEKIRNLLADHNSLQALNISLVIMCARDYDCILKQLRDLHSCELRLIPFSPSEKSSYLNEHLKEIMSGNIKNDLFEEVTNSAPAFEAICSTPLSLEMVAKIIKNKVSKNNCIESLSKIFDTVTNIYDFYSCYLQVIKDEFAQDNDKLRGAFDRYYIDSLRKFAAKCMFSDFPNLLDLLNVDDSYEINKDALNVGLIKELNGEYKFVHKTFEEYFAAEFLWDCLCNKKKQRHDLLLEVLNTVFLKSEYLGVLDFIEEILKINPNEKISKISSEYNLALTTVNWKKTYHF
uniref:Uncharacterized protein LOC114339404 n=1 Tax=Diabrotica virgifera virgifera TaxID=50390 RepID=A0A6P7GQ09_DIAVI